MAKSPEAFRTISEVSAVLETPAHVLRFWESKFQQVKPVKRAGGRRYYRPDDIQLLAGIKRLLHEQGMTIRGVQRILREQGVRHVASLSPQGWAEGAVEGVILGPWPTRTAANGEDPEDGIDEAAADDDLGDEAESALSPFADEADEADGSEEILDPDEALEAEAEPAEEAPVLAAAEPEASPAAVEDSPGHGAAEGGSPLAAFLAGTMAHLAASAPAAAPAEPEAPPPEPLPPTLDSVRALIRRVDPDRLRARADRIAPLLARLRALATGDGAPAP